WGSVETDIVNAVIGRKSKTTVSGSKDDRRSITVTAKGLTGQEVDGWRVCQLAANGDVTDSVVLGCSNQSVDRRNCLCSAVHGTNSHKVPDPNGWSGVDVSALGSVTP